MSEILSFSLAEGALQEEVLWNRYFSCLQQQKADISNDITSSKLLFRKSWDFPTLPVNDWSVRVIMMLTDQSYAHNNVTYVCIKSFGSQQWGWKELDWFYFFWQKDYRIIARKYATLRWLSPQELVSVRAGHLQEVWSQSGWWTGAGFRMKTAGQTLLPALCLRRSTSWLSRLYTHRIRIKGKH